MSPDAIEVESISADEDTGRAVRVSWIDSGLAVQGWTHRHELPTNVSEVESVGIWVGENEQVIAIAGSKSEDGLLNCQLIWKPSLLGKEWL